jgi:type II secretory pathway predicted ATPase ExeA
LTLTESQRKSPVIIAGEGPILGRQVLEGIRFLPNFGMDPFSPVSLILLGQQELGGDPHHADL